MTRKRIYDEQISPLMRQIIAICKAHDIPALATFQINDDRPDGDGFYCTTALPFPGTADALLRAAKCMRAPEPLLMRITTYGANGEPKRVDMIASLDATPDPTDETEVA